MVSSKFACGDVRGAVRIVTSNDKVLENTPEVLQKLKSKHPEVHPNSNLPPPPSEEQVSNSLQVAVKDIKKGIQSFNNGSGGGPDGLLPKHLKDLTAESQGQVGIDLLEAIANFFNAIVLCGDIPDSVKPSFYGATLLALSKPDGGVRPMAMGNTLRRWAGKTVKSNLANFTSSVFKQQQLGVGSPSGAEVASHSLRRYNHTANHPDSTPEGKIILKIDFKNAFNSIRRDVVLKEVQKQIPSIYPLIWQSYSQPSMLFFGDNTISSQEGVQQGGIKKSAQLITLCHWRSMKSLQYQVCNYNLASHCELAVNSQCDITVSLL